MSNISDDQALEALLSSAQSKEQSRDQSNRNHNRGQNSTKKRFNDDDHRNNDRYRNDDRGGGGRDRGRGDRDDYYGPRGGDRDNRNSDSNRSFQSKRQRRFHNRKDEEKEDSKFQWGDNNKNDDDNDNHNNNDEEATQNNAPKEKANFGLTGALQEDETTGNTINGIVLKFSEPPEARTPNTRWRLYVFKKKSSSSTTSNEKEEKDGGLLQTLHISKQSAYLFGRERKVADIPVDHPSLSKQHCVLQYRSLPDKNDREQRLRCKPYLMDLGSTNGTFINGVRIDDARYYELRKGDVITLGASTREYVLLTENTTSSDL